MRSVVDGGGEWGASLAMLRQPVLARQAQGSLALSWLLLVLTVCGAMSAFADSPHRALLFAALTATPLAMLLLMWWIYWCGSVLEQCRPAAVYLIPCLRERALRITVVVWLLIVAVMTALLGTGTGLPLHVAAITGLVLIEIGVMATPRRVAVVLALGWSIKLLGAPWTTSALHLLASPLAALLLSAAVLLEGRAALRRLFPLRGASMPSAWLDRLGPALALWRKARQGAAAARKGATVEMSADASANQRQAPFIRPLGRSSFGGELRIALVILALCASARLFQMAFGHGSLGVPVDVLAGARLMLVVGVLLLLALVVATEATRLDQRRAELRLLCLTPAAPLRGAVDAVLARMRLAGFARLWSMSTLSILGGALLLGAHMGEVAHLALACAVSLTLAGVLIRRSIDSSGAAVAVPLGVFTLAACGAAAIAVTGIGSRGQWQLLVIATMAGGAIFAGWRWRAMVKPATA